jgi:hypothetical protein
LKVLKPKYSCNSLFRSISAVDVVGFMDFDTVL